MPVQIEQRLGLYQRLLDLVSRLLATIESSSGIICWFVREFSRRTTEFSVKEDLSDYFYYYYV